MNLSVRTEQIINDQVVTNRQLETLCAVAEKGSKSAAARKLGISVPVAHKYISVIEKAVGLPVTKSTPRGTHLTAEGKRIVDTYLATELRCIIDRKFTICCSPVTEDLMMSVLSALKIKEVELVISDDEHNIRMMKEDLADFSIIDDPLYLYDAEEFEGEEVGYMSMVMVDHGKSFIKYKYGAQRVAFMFLDTMDAEYTIDSETFSLPELLGSNKSFFIDEFLLIRKGLKMKSAVDPKILRHSITAIYRKETKDIRRIIKALQLRDIK